MHSLISKFSSLACWSAVIWGLSVSVAWASTPWAHGGGATLYPLDVATGAVGTQVTFSTGGSSVFTNDLAGESLSQGALIWGIGGFTGDNHLVAFDPSTAQLVSTVSISVSGLIRSLAIDPTTGGFFGASATSLYRISPATGAATLVGATSLNVDKALGFDNFGNLFGIANENQLVAVNKLTGATVLRATLGVLRMEDIAARPETGIMYGIGYGPNYSLYQIDLNNGALVNLGPSLSRPQGFAFAAVPEPGGATLSLIVLVPMALARRGIHPWKRATRT